MTTTTFDTAAFDRAIDPIVGLMTPDQARALLSYHGDDALRRRIDELAAKSNEGNLTEAERAEYQGYIRANNFIAILQAKARKRLALP